MLRLDFFLIILGYSLALMKNVKIKKNFLVEWFMSLKEKSLILRIPKQNGQNITISLTTNVLRKKLDLKSLILDGKCCHLLLSARAKKRLS